MINSIDDYEINPNQQLLAGQQLIHGLRPTERKIALFLLVELIVAQSFYITICIRSLDFDPINQNYFLYYIFITVAAILNFLSFFSKFISKKTLLCIVNLCILFGMTISIVNPKINVELTQVCPFVALILAIYEYVSFKTFYFGLCVWTFTLFYVYIIDLNKTFYQGQFAWQYMIVLDTICAFALVRLFQAYSNNNRFAEYADLLLNWKLIILTYFWSILLTICVTCSMQQIIYNSFSKFSWINHSAFLVILIYSIAKRRYLFPKWCSVIKANNPSQFFVYQISTSLFCLQEDFQSSSVHSRQSIAAGQPLGDCVCCLSEQSSHLYVTCLHACVGQNCLLYWLQKKMNKCPVCRAQSRILAKVQRIVAQQFKVTKKYQFQV